MSDHNAQVREAIKKSMSVLIAINPNDDEARWVGGRVDNIVTPESIPYVSEGIKVRITDGTIGFVQRILKNDEISDSEILEMISTGETKKIEFKETFKVSTSLQQKLDCLRYATVKTIAAFMNTKGGTLLIGVNDAGSIVGISRDYDHTNTVRPSQPKSDRLKQEIQSYVKSKLGDDALIHLYEIAIKNVNKKEICVIRVDPSSLPVFVNREILYDKCGTNNQVSATDTVFYLRHDSGITELDARKAFKFLRDRQPPNA